ncbi:hypothetical protein L2E82_03289 [Cichorium intybus]|uniref:Uncharacterized protein n=1 Tax=Cichorium intybus TaxID=13427 RepID=A0ACB9H3A3_CICIN|nr:hypothetical protein L2E82_03289 [Cichorium intybus]
MILLLCFYLGFASLLTVGKVMWKLDHLTPYLNQILKGYSPRQTTLIEEAQHKYCSSSTTISKKIESGSSSNSKRPSQNFLTSEFLGPTVCTCDILTMEVNMELEKMKEKQEVNLDKVNRALSEFALMQNDFRIIKRWMNIYKWSLIGVSTAVVAGCVVFGFLFTGCGYK